MSRVAYTYDELGRVKTRTLGLTGDAGTETYSYDELGRLQAMTNPLSQTSGGNVPFEWIYDGPGGRLSEMRYPNGMKTMLGYGSESEDRQLESMRHWKPGMTGKYSEFAYEWDVVGRLTQWDQTINMTSGGAQVRRAIYGYDAADQSTSAVWQNATGVEVNRRTWSYDSMGNRLSETRPGNEATIWKANGFNQLTSVSGARSVELRGTVDQPAEVKVAGQVATMDGLEWSRTMLLPSGENQVPIEARELEGTNGPAQTSKGHVHVTVDAVEGAPAQVYSYDANGNMLTDGVRTYEWDAENRLVRVSWSTEGTAHTSDFVYDGMSRRVGIIDDGNHRGFVWDGLTIVEERSANGTLVKRFWGSGEERAGAEPVKLCYTRDHLGSIREMVDGSGAVRARYAYDEWGQRTKLEGDLDCDFGFTGHFEHAASGTTLSLYRGYDASVGRWLSPDPIEESGGLNLYRYVGNSPADRYDPLGLRDPRDVGGNLGFANGSGEPLGSHATLEDMQRAALGLAAAGAFAVLAAVDPRAAALLAAEAIDSANEQGDESNCETASIKRRPSNQLKKEWANVNGKPWPQDPNTGKDQIAHHKKALADGGEDHGRNVEPKPQKDHIKLHKENGDFKRWGARRLPIRPR